MIADTIVIVLVCIMPAQQLKVNQNRFETAFEQADKEFDKKYKLDIETLKCAAHEATISAYEKTKAEREKVMRPLFDVNKLLKKEEK